MANELNIVLASSGLTVTCQPFQAGSAVGSTIALTESGTSGFYSGNMTGSAGTYLLAFYDGTKNVGSGSIVWSGSSEVPVSTLTSGDLPSVPTAADVWSHATRTITGGTVDTLTNAPTVPSASAIAGQVRTELEPELTKVSALNTERLANVATTNIVGTLLAQAHS
jgi:hypothetical protein